MTYWLWHILMTYAGPFTINNENPKAQLIYALGLMALILLNSWIRFGYNFWCYVPIDVTWTITVWMIFWILLCLLHVLTDNRQHYLLLLFKMKFMKVKGISCSLFNVIWLQIWMKGRIVFLQLFTPAWVAYIGLHCHLKNKHNCDNENCVLFACNFYG